MTNYTYIVKVGFLGCQWACKLPTLKLKILLEYSNHSIKVKVTQCNVTSIMCNERCSLYFYDFGLHSHTAYFTRSLLSLNGSDDPEYKYNNKVGLKNQEHLNLDYHLAGLLWLNIITHSTVSREETESIEQGICSPFVSRQGQSDSATR